MKSLNPLLTLNISDMENKIRKSALLMSLMMAVIFLWSCGGGNSQQNAMEEKLLEAKESATENLNDLNKDLDDRIAYIDEQLETAGEEIKEDLMAARAELEEQKAIVAQELKNVEEAGLETWDSVVSATQQMVVKIKSSTNDASLKVRELLGNEE
jgi:lipopolysaccharide export LptBFGC system permease protein LptF